MLTRGTAQYVLGMVPLDASAAGNAALLNGDWVSLKNANHCEIIVAKGVGGAGEAITITLEQATDVAGTGAKALNFNKKWVKSGTDMLVIGAPTYTRTGTPGQSSGEGTNTHATTALNQELVVIEIDAQDLDVQGGFDCLRAKINDPGTTLQAAMILYRLSETNVNAETANFIA